MKLKKGRLSNCNDECEGCRAFWFGSCPREQQINDPDSIHFIKRSR